MNNYHVEIAIDHLETHSKLFFKGYLIYNTITKVKKILQSVENGVGHYILDMNEVIHIDSTGFGAFVNFAKDLIDEATKIVIVVKDPLIRELFEISQFHLIFPIVETHQEALQLLNEGYQPPLSIHEY